MYFIMENKKIKKKLVVVYHPEICPEIRIIKALSQLRLDALFFSPATEVYLILV